MSATSGGTLAATGRQSGLESRSADAADAAEFRATADGGIRADGTARIESDRSVPVPAVNGSGSPPSPASPAPWSASHREAEDESTTGNAGSPGIRSRLAALGRRCAPAVASAAWGVASLLLLLGSWQIFSMTVGGDLPSPVSTGRTLAGMLADPFNPDRNALGIGLQLAESLKRVAIGFALGSLIAIPVGVLMGSTPVARRLLNPIAQILRPVSPLVWFPLALVAFRSMGGTATATYFTILVTSLWPTMISTAFGVGSLPEDYRTVARVFQFSRDRYLRRILLPHALPHILTGLRVSMGIAWLVIVATEMLSGGVGIGFFAWDAYNAGSYEHMVAAVVIIGFVGLVLDLAFDLLLRRTRYP